MSEALNHSSEFAANLPESAEREKNTNIPRVALFVIGGLLLFNVVYMSRVANPTIGFTLQAVIAVGFIVYALLYNRIPKIIHIIAASLCLIPVAFTLFLAIYGNISNADHTEDVVIVLGAGVSGEQVSRTLAFRLDEALLFWRQNPEAYILVTGGLGNRATITEAEAMARYLEGRGMPRERILLEDQSTSTYENLVFAREILEERFPNGFRATLVTNDFHIYRAVRTARQAELDVTHIGARTVWYTWPVNSLREMLAVTSFWFSR